MTEYWLTGFSPLFIPWTTSAQIQRTVIRHAWRYAKKKGNILVQSHEILGRYRQRLLAIEPFWPRIRDDPVHLRRLANCPPTFFVPIQKHRGDMCRARLICPWCHSRWVREIWEATVALLYPEDKLQPATQSVYFWSTPGIRIAEPAGVPAWLYANRVVFQQPPVPDIVGHLRWYLTVPCSVTEPTVWCQTFCMGLTTNHEPALYKRVRPGYGELSRAFCDYFRYPRGWARGQCFAAGELLTLLKGKRLCERYGSLRAQPGVKDNNGQEDQQGDSNPDNRCNGNDKARW